MNQKLIVLGSPEPSDLALLRRISMELGCEIIKQQGGQRSMEIGAEVHTAGILSFLPCTRESMMEAYNGALNFRGAAPVPFFQLIPGGEQPSFLNEMQITGVFVSPLTAPVVWSIVQTVLMSKRIVSRNSELIAELIKTQKYKNLLVEVGTALSRENDLDRLLDVILLICRDITGADAGSIYIRERTGPGGAFLDMLRFKITQNDSVVIGRRSVEFQLPIDNESIAGYVANTGKPLKIDDIARIDASQPYRPGNEVQKRLGYCVKSMLTLPLKNKDTDVVGVLQLMNKKKSRSAKVISEETCSAHVTSFSLADIEFIQSVAAQAAVSIERAQLYENIRELFEGFLGSSIAAIDERDRVTSGHSKRVMGYAMAFVDAATADPHGPFAELAASPDRKRQFQFAALLHDIGKIGVPERVLQKESRLAAPDFALLLARLDFITLAHKHEPASVSWQSAQELADDRAFLEKINIAGRLQDDDLTYLAVIRDKWYHGIDGKKALFLSEREWQSLSIRAGTLTREERDIINSHALSTYRILSKIPWTRQLEMIPTIASTHHEKMDGSGYPHGLKGEKICLESRILAVIDIYEALVAQDRPYKPRMAPEKAMAILEKEVEAGRLDGKVVRYLREKGIYKLYTDLNKHA
ncbi:MAG: GAF domain-containing protein [Chitinispirillaceae bacterium]|nr:GAF domain-containing protein [Chitinispirillaceae bacterium]